jgi:adenylyltransferase/sulfurtransferase
MAASEGDRVMDQVDRMRYARQIRLPEVGEAGQEKLLRARLLVVGIGGLGSPVALYLAAAGVGRLVLCDYDWVDASNLQRQIAHRHADIGESKVISAKARVEALNPRVHVDAIDHELDDESLLGEARVADAIVDCTDNFPSRFALNRASVAAATPLVSGAAIRWQGQVATFDPRRPGAACYRCLYPDESVAGGSCAAEGIAAPVVGVIGSMQALEVLKLLLGAGSGLCGRLLLFDGISMECQTIAIERRVDCPACGGDASAGGTSRMARAR